MTDNRLNIILFSFDDCIAFHHYRELFGHTLKIPNIDVILGTSTHFQSAYCQTSLCGPSRASFMTARTPHELGIFDHDVKNFQVIKPEEIWSYKLKEAGYFCSSGGKIHHGYGPVEKSIHKVLYSDERKEFGHDFKLKEDLEKKRYGGIRGGWATTNPQDDGVYYDAKSADSAIHFLQTYNGSAPFYREIGFFSPHGPRYTPVRFKEMYNLRQFKPPKSWDNGFDDHSYSDAIWPQTHQLVNNKRHWWALNVMHYFSALSHADYHIGRIWKALKNSRFSDNTVIIFLTDHGFLMGARNRFYKSTIWELSAGVPLIIHDPSRPQPRVVLDPVALLDVGPTVMDYAGLPPLVGTKGRSLRPQVEGAKNPDRVIPNFRFNNISIRKGNYRMAYFEDGSTQLFDLTTDIWNHKDLGTEHPEHTSMFKALFETGTEYGWSMPQ